VAKTTLKSLREKAAAVPELAALAESDPERLEEIIRWAQGEDDPDQALEFAADEIDEPSDEEMVSGTLPPGFRWVTIRVPYVDPVQILDRPQSVTFATYHDGRKLKTLLQGCLFAAKQQSKRLEHGRRVNNFADLLRWMLEQAVVE